MSSHNKVAPTWSGLFPKGDFEWTLRMRLADPVEFFRAADSNGDLLKQKAELIAEHSERHLALTPEADGLLDRLCQELRGWGLELADEPESFSALTYQIEPDFLLLDRSSQKLLAASVCFPSSWEPAKWIGKPLTEIHDVVPQLNPQIGPMIERFLSQLSPGKAYRRANWSLTHGKELNYHPALKRPPIMSSTPIDEIYLRLEHQIFTAIPNAIMMGIRIEPVQLISLKAYQELWQQILEKLETMPGDVARYKSLDRGLPSIIRQMQDVNS